MTRPIKKMVFDNDGVNIDSETVAITVLAELCGEMLQHHDSSINLADHNLASYKHYAGTSGDAILRGIIGNEENPLSIDLLTGIYGLTDIDQSDRSKDAATRMAQILTDRTNDAFKQKLEAIPGIQEALRKLDEMLGSIENRALCTTSPKDRMNISLEYAKDPKTGESAGLDKLFPDEGGRRISGYGHDNKYVYFMELHPDWDPAETAIVEDSISGVEKAKAASPDFRVIGTVAAEYYGSTYEEKREHIAEMLAKGASIVVTDVADLPAAVEWLNNGMDMDNAPDFTGIVHHNTNVQPPLEWEGPNKPSI